VTLIAFSTYGIQAAIAIAEQRSIVLEMTNRLRRKVFLKFGIVAAALAALAGILAWKSQESRYKGRTVESWVSQIDPRPKPAQAPEVVAAIEHFGTNALPHLVELLASGNPPPWRWKLWRIINHRPWLDPTRGARNKQAQAVEAFRILASKADSAAPQIAPLLSNENTAIPAADALLAIGSGTNLLRTVKAGLTNQSPDVRTMSLHVFKQLRPQPADATEIFHALLNDPDPEVRFEAVQQLGFLKGEVSAVALAVAEKLNDPDGSVREITCVALANLGLRAQGAGNAVRRVLEILSTKTDPDKTRIETMVLPNLGIKAASMPEAKNSYE
jgi:HEAT repeat protein